MNSELNWAFISARFFSAIKWSVLSVSVLSTCILHMNCHFSW